MQDVNDDMDLFRRAAEDYPLNTDSSDFNEVLKKLSAKQAGKINKKPHQKLIRICSLYFNYSQALNPRFNNCD